jgi:hypothetical protein
MIDSSDQKNEDKDMDEQPAECWEIVNHKESRTKIAHALRDKRESQDHEAAFSRLKIRNEELENLSKCGLDSLYIAANAMILTVELTGRESETLIKALLCDAIDSVGEHTASDCTRDYESIPFSNEVNGEMIIEVTNSSNVNVGCKQGNPSFTMIHCANDPKEVMSQYQQSPDTFQSLLSDKAPIFSQVMSHKSSNDFQYQNKQNAIEWNRNVFIDSRDLHRERY